MVREHRGGSNHSRRAWKRGGGARAEPFGERYCARSVERRAYLCLGLGKGELGLRGNLRSSGFCWSGFPLPALCGPESKESVTSVRDTEGS